MSKSLAKQDQLLQRARLEAQSALSESTFYALRQLRVDEEDGRLLISGRVQSFYYKQVAQELVRAVAGQLPVVNGVRVQ